jgi:predicted methyltransferase
MKTIILACAAALALSSCATMDYAPRNLAAAAADPARPQADRDRDSDRRPVETMAFAGVRPGMRIAEIIPGGGYYTRLLSAAVGPRGTVYALVSERTAARPGGLDAINALAAQRGNVRVIPVDFYNFRLPEGVDLVWTTENYHDLLNGPTAHIEGFNRSVRDALRPGGIFYVEDHAAPGTGASATSTLHRVDPALVRAQVEAVGLQLEAQSALLANPADPHTARVQDSAIRGRTDKFMFRFRKAR